MAKYLVTGGGGFIGSHIVEELFKRGNKVRIIDDFSSGKRENLYPLLTKIEVWEADIRDYMTCQRMVEGIDFVLHQAALPSVRRSIDDPLLVNDVNIKGTLNMLLASREAKVKRFIYASSSSVYGDNSSSPKTEESAGVPLSPYAISKFTAENYCRVFSQIYGLYTVCLRYFNVFGPRQNSLSEYAAVIPKFITRILDEKSPVIFGSGTQTRDFTYVSNVVEANMLASKASGISGQIFNVGCGKRITVNTVALYLNRILNKDVRSVFTDPRPGDVMHSCADISKAERTLKYEPLVAFNKGLEKTVRWYMREK